MILKNIKHKSGYLIESKKGTVILEGNTGMSATFPNQDMTSLVPKRDNYESEYQEITLNLANVYNDLLDKVISIKDKKINRNEAITRLADRWGFLYLPFYSLSKHSLFSDDEILKEVEKQSRFKSYDGEKEYKNWGLLVDKIIPSSQSFLYPYLKKNDNEPTLDDFNSCLIGGVNIEYKSIARTSYEVTPTNLLSAITIFSKSRKERRKKEAVIICAYSKCNNEIIQNIGVGRGRTTCSDSCRTLKARENTKKSK